MGEYIGYPGLLAGATFASYQYHIVKIASTAGEVRTPRRTSCSESSRMTRPMARKPTSPVLAFAKWSHQPPLRLVPGSRPTQRAGP